MAATLKVRKWHAWNGNVSVRLVKSLHEPYQALLSTSIGNGTVRYAEDHHWSTRPAKSLKRANRLCSDFSFFLLSSVRTVSQANTITAEAITTKKSRKNIINHWVLHSPPIISTNSDWSTISGTPVCLYACLYTPFFWIRQLRHRPEATKRV